MENEYNEEGATFEQRHLMNQTEANLRGAMGYAQVGIITGGDSRLLVKDDAGNFAKTVITKGTDPTAGKIAKFKANGEIEASVLTDTAGIISSLDPVLNTQEPLAFNRNDVTLWETGFCDPDNIDVSYGTNRTVTITNLLGGGNKISALYQGQYVAGFEVTTFTSTAHDAADNEYWLYHDGSSFQWANTFPGMDKIIIALAYRDGANFCLRECHGAQYTTAQHGQHHLEVGSTLVSGGDLSSYTLASTTATNRRPQISATVISDDGLYGRLPALTTNAYSRIQLSGANTTGISVDNAEIVNLSTNRPYYNQFTGGAWQQTLMSANAYQKIFVLAIPVTSDADCQKMRYIFIQGQVESTTLATIQALTFASVNLGHIANVLPEFVPIAEIIIQYQGANWQLTSVTKLTGSQRNSVATPAGNYLSTVAHDTTLTGSGATGDPLGVLTVAPYTTANLPTGQADGRIAYDTDRQRLVVYNSTLSLWTLGDGIVARGTATTNGSGVLSVTGLSGLNGDTTIVGSIHIVPVESDTALLYKPSSYPSSSSFEKTGLSNTTKYIWIWYAP